MKNDIKLIRGNTAFYDIEVYIGDEPYTLHEDDVIKFTVKKGTDKNCPVILEKKVTALNYDENSILKVEFSPEDTIDLKTDRYFYDCAIQFPDGDFYTFISKSDFVITDAISEKE